MFFLRAKCGDLLKIALFVFVCAFVSFTHSIVSNVFAPSAFAPNAFAMMKSGANESPDEISELDLDSFFDFDPVAENQSGFELPSDIAAEAEFQTKNSNGQLAQIHPFQYIPNDVMHRIFSMLDIGDYGRLRRVDKFFLEALSEKKMNFFPAEMRPRKEFLALELDLVKIGIKKGVSHFSLVSKNVDTNLVQVIDPSLALRIITLSLYHPNGSDMTNYNDKVWSLTLSCEQLSILSRGLDLTFEKDRLLLRNFKFSSLRVMRVLNDGKECYFSPHLMGALPNLTHFSAPGHFELKNRIQIGQVINLFPKLDSIEIYYFSPDDFKLSNTRRIKNLTIKATDFPPAYDRNLWDEFFVMFPNLENLSYLSFLYGAVFPVLESHPLRTINTPLSFPADTVKRSPLIKNPLLVRTQWDRKKNILTIIPKKPHEFDTLVNALPEAKLHVIEPKQVKVLTQLGMKTPVSRQIEILDLSNWRIPKGLDAEKELRTRLEELQKEKGFKQLILSKKLLPKNIIMRSWLDRFQKSLPGVDIFVVN